MFHAGRDVRGFQDSLAGSFGRIIVLDGFGVDLFFVWWLSFLIFYMYSDEIMESHF
jgi:hypothetical protein